MVCALSRCRFCKHSADECKIKRLAFGGLLLERGPSAPALWELVQKNLLWGQQSYTGLQEWRNPTPTRLLKKPREGYGAEAWGNCNRGLSGGREIAVQGAISLISLAPRLTHWSCLGKACPPSRLWLAPWSRGWRFGPGCVMGVGGGLLEHVIGQRESCPLQPNKNYTSKGKKKKKKAYPYP